MALNKTPAANAAPQFEGMEDSTPDTTAAPQNAPAAPATESTSREVAAAPANPVSTAVRGKFGPALEQFRNVIDPATLEFNTFTRVTVGLDGFEDDQKKDLGKVIKLQLMSFNDRFVLSPGVQGSEATEFVRYSIDGKTIQGTGEDCMTYLKNLKEVEGYKDASMKQYMSIYGMLTHANGADVPVEDQHIVALQVPPQSRALFTRLQVESGIKIAQGVMQPTDVLVCTQEKQQGKTAKFAIIKFSNK